MNDILFAVALVVFAVYGAFHISYLIDLKRTSAALREFIKSTEGNFSPSLEELRGTLVSVKKIADDAAAAVENIRQVTETAVALEGGVKKLYEYYKDDFGPTASANIAGLKAGIKTGVSTLLRTLKDRKEG